MVNFTLEQIISAMENQRNIRNISVIAHVDHGKTTLTDALISKGGIINDSMTGKKQFMSRRKDEQMRSITIKSNAVSLYFEVGCDDIDNKMSESGDGNDGYLFNLIDCPGHIDFSSEVTASLRISDGALVVVDCIEGVCVQTETVLRQSIDEFIKPILFLNKMDRLFNELNQSNEDIYKTLLKTIESVNVIISTYTTNGDGINGMSEYICTLSPENGSVGFGCGLYGWGFTLRDFATIYSGKFGLSTHKLMQKFWGNHFWDSTNHKWTKQQNDEGSLSRGFNEFILKPIRALIDSIMNNEVETYGAIIKLMGIKISHKELEDLNGKNLLGVVMRRWIHAGDALIDMIINNLPSPLESQSHRCIKLYSGEQDSNEANYIRNCDVNGPMSMYISKMIPTFNNDSRFIAFGRVFSGVLKTGQSVRVYGSNYVYGGSNDLSVVKIKRIILMMGRNDEQINQCPAGNICGIIGLDNALYKCGTITTSDLMYPFLTMKFSVSAIVEVAVEAVNASDLPKLVDSIKKLTQSDPLVKHKISNNGEHIIAGAGELHIEICLKDLREIYMKNLEINVSEPIVSFCETITSLSGADTNDTNYNYPSICVSKSPNKLNRIYMSSSPLNNESFIDAIEKKEIKLSKLSCMKSLSRLLSEKYDWNIDEAKKIWTFGCPPDSIGNVLVDCTRGVQYLNNVKDSIIQSFMQVSKCGVLCHENLRGIRYNLCDALIHSDPTHRNDNSIIPMCRRAFYACQLSSCPRLMEPFYLVDINVPNEFVSVIYNTFSLRRGVIIDVIERDSTPLILMRAHLPVCESFGFNDLLRAKTCGNAFAQMKFSHWDIINSDPFNIESKSYQLIMDIRKRKGLKLQLPSFNDFHDRIN